MILQIAVGTCVCLLYCWIHNQHAVAAAFYHGAKAIGSKNVARCDVTRFDLVPVKCLIRFFHPRTRRFILIKKKKKVTETGTVSLMLVSHWGSFVKIVLCVFFFFW